MRLSHLWARKRPEPSYPRLPECDEHGETTVSGVYVVGEIAGTPLIKLGLNAGHQLVQRLATQFSGELPAGHHDLVIIGAGAAGIGAASAAQDLNLSAVVLEANHFAETVYTMTKGKVIFAEPDSVPTQGRMWFEECTKEELLERWSAQVSEFGLDVRTFEKVENIEREGDWLVVTSQKGTYRARRVLMAAGKAGNPRKAGVPGEVEHGAKIDHRLIDPDVHSDQDILIYGGGDVALEGALSLCETNRVTLVTVDEQFVYPKKRNIEAVQAKVAEGRLELHFNSFLKSVSEKSVTFSVGGPDGAPREVPNDQVFEMIGAELPFAFFERVGIQLENRWYWKRWAALALIFVFVYSLYALKTYGKGITAWPFEGLISEGAFDLNLRRIFEASFAPFAWLFEESAYQDILANRGFQQGYVYSLAYTLVMLFFGWEAMIRWRGIARNKKYQTYRYLSLMTFQLGFFLIVNILAVKAMTVEHAWRAWGLYQPYPLFVNTFFWWDGNSLGAGFKWFIIGAGLFGTFVAIPILARYHGKRFCTWVCGCGGLAETLGDRWRHLAPKGERSRHWNFQSGVVLAASAILLLVIVGMYNTSGSNAWWNSYNYIVDFWLVAVIPVTLYPFFGGKIWCRYWCPLAAWNEALAKWFGKLGIKSNDKCISCTQCSKYCQVGVDVMAFAKNQEFFDNKNSNCIHCGICIDVCPMDVLSFGELEAPAQAPAEHACPSAN